MTTVLPTNQETSGLRLKAERLRLGLTQQGMASIAGVAKNTLINWERSQSSPVEPIAALAEAGADVLFIVTGVRATPTPEFDALVGVTIRQALAMLDPVDRHRLLLDLLATELRA